MGKDKPPTGSVYPRESIICYFLFLVELAAVWSLVAIIYNTFMVYIPTANEKEEGLITEPVMCTTTRNVLSNKCTWWSCMEWCLSATEPPDECIHIFARVRKPGTTVRLSECTPAEIRRCVVLDLDDPFADDIIFNCKEDFVCNTLTGTFRCEDPYQPQLEEYQKRRGGFCKNITSMYEFETGDTFDCAQRKADCLELEGMFECNEGKCTQVLDYHCERRCKNIACDKNVILQSGDNIFLGDCQNVYNNDTEELLWTNDGVNTLLANCLHVELDDEDPYNTTYYATDCVNGTVMPRELLPKVVNYTKLLELFQSELGYVYRLDESGDENSTRIPFDIDIIIYNETKLKMNHEGCSNELEEKCTFFHREYGKDGRNYTTRSRFPCYYTDRHGEFVTAFLDLERSEKIFLLALIIPVSIFVFSCFFCLCCSYCIIVDEEGHMHLRGCYDFFRRPYTEYEKWAIQHEKKRKRREQKELKRQLKEEKKLQLYRQEMERRREEIRAQQYAIDSQPPPDFVTDERKKASKSSRQSFTDISVNVHGPEDI